MLRKATTNEKVKGQFGTTLEPGTSGYVFDTTRDDAGEVWVAFAVKGLFCFWCKPDWVDYDSSNKWTSSGKDS